MRQERERERETSHCTLQYLQLQSSSQRGTSSCWNVKHVAGPSSSYSNPVLIRTTQLLHYIYIQRPYKNVSRPSGFPWWCWKQISETIADGNNVTKERHSKEFRPMATVWLGQTKSSATPRNETNLKASPFSLLRIVYNLDDQSLPVVPISFSFSLRRSVTSFSADTLRLGFYFSSLLLLYTRQHNVINLMCQWALGVCACRLSAARSSS